MKRLLTILCIAAASCCYAADEDHSRTLSASGDGTVKVIAKIADVTLGIEAVATTAEGAQRQLADRQANVLEALRGEEKADKIETSNISLYPRYDPKDYTVIIGYVAEATITFSADVEDAGHLIDLGISSGANKNRGISVRADQETLAAARVQALQHAADAAMAEGKTVLEALGLTYQGIHRVQVSPRSGHTPSYRSYKLEASAAQADTPVEVTAQEVDVYANVALVLKYLQ